jgi:hypothetical protein
MFSSWYNVAMLAVESQQVIWLRTLKLAAGGPGAQVEAERMVSEKIAAATKATVNLMSGQSPDQIVKAYRRTVKANARRLGR